MPSWSSAPHCTHCPHSTHSSDGEVTGEAELLFLDICCWQARFKIAQQEHGHTVLGFAGSTTCLETPGPGAYNPYPFLNPTVHRTTIGRHFPDRAPGFRNVVDRMPAPWRPEPMSLSRLQSEQPLVHYASATFWAWPEQRRRSAAALRHERQMNDMTSKSSASKEDSGSTDWHEDLMHQGNTLPRDPTWGGLGRSRSDSALKSL
ncbi:unnamed protein product [Symbiodinium natans]|uniref:Uncharacterized protein n=1 Tax=Symbiodinium natans TaxID=878477 RepID=A0A812V8A0_9DINO|nr:unnamed protein product [Symbiodinium natans]